MVSKLKRMLAEWEKIFASYILDKELIAKIYRKLKKLNYNNINDPMKTWANELSRTFQRKKSKWLKKHMKKCSPSQATKEMQIKTMLRFHLTPVRMATIKNTKDNNCIYLKYTTRYCDTHTSTMK
jgi:recombination DNA repair RAD52 pathway protein